jgi:hypothetical protein
VDTSLLEPEDWKILKDAVEVAIPGLSARNEIKAVLGNKVFDLNKAPQSLVNERAIGALGIALSGTEKKAWKQRNVAAHGTETDDAGAIELIREIKLLRVLFHGMLLSHEGKRLLLRLFLVGPPSQASPAAGSLTNRYCLPALRRCDRDNEQSHWRGTIWATLCREGFGRGRTSPRTFTGRGVEVATMKPRKQNLSFSVALLALARASVNAYALPEIRILATGGTIAVVQSGEGSADYKSGAVSVVDLKRRAGDQRGPRHG